LHIIMACTSSSGRKELLSVSASIIFNAFKKQIMHQYSTRSAVLRGSSGDRAFGASRHVSFFGTILPLEKLGGSVGVSYRYE
jgi:hypothetical protein